MSSTEAAPEFIWRLVNEYEDTPGHWKVYETKWFHSPTHPSIQDHRNATKNTSQVQRQKGRLGHRTRVFRYKLDPETVFDDGKEEQCQT